MSLVKSSDDTVLSAARWFWWIAGLSLVNTVLFFAGSDTNFVVGLGLTTLSNSVFEENIPIAVAAAAAAIGFYVFIGLQAQKERLWAFYLGLVIYALDALVFLLVQDWLPVAFHGLAIFFIVQGITRIRSRAPAAA